MVKRLDLTGKTFGRWRVDAPGVDTVYPNGRRKAFWRCVCACGNEREVAGEGLKAGDSRSCGCLQIEMQTPSRERDIRRLTWSVLRLPWSGCWIVDPETIGKRGSFWLDGKVQGSSRAAYRLLVGPVPGHLDVCHHCDIGVCINPEHLFLGTAKDNMQDCSKKGRLGGATKAHQQVVPRAAP